MLEGQSIFSVVDAVGGHFLDGVGSGGCRRWWIWFGIPWLDHFERIWDFF
jgi:hypothetical protein